MKRTRRCQAVAGAIGAAAATWCLGAGCIPSGDDDSAANEYAQTVDSAFPEPGTQQLPEGGAITFSVSGGDVDSLQLAWQWELDGDVQSLGDSAEGSFETSMVLQWWSAGEGSSVDVRFVVDDGDYPADVTWPVELE